MTTFLFVLILDTYKYLQNLVHDKEHKILKKLDHQRESGSGNSPSDSSNGLLGQVNFEP